MRTKAIFSTLLLLLGTLFSSVSVANPTASILVRFKDPQKLNFKTALKTLAVNPLGNLNQFELVNAEEGLIKIQFENETTAESARQLLSRSNLIRSASPNLLYRPLVRYRFHEAASLTVAPSMATTLATAPLAALLPLFQPVVAPTLPEVLFPIPRQTFGPDPLAEKDWAIKAIRLDQVLHTAPQAQSEILTAVLDTGIDYNHGDLVAALWRKPGAPQEVGYDFAHNHSKPYDVKHFDLEGCLKDPLCPLGLQTEKFLVNAGHGTHCAGHIAAVAGNSLGIRGVGGAGVRVMGLKFFYDYGEKNAGNGDDAGAIRAIDFAIQNGVKVINASWGGRVLRETAEASELKQALIRAQKAGVLVVVAAGNFGMDQDVLPDPVFPAAYDLDNLIVVAATQVNDKLADFSNYGKKTVHLAAPGEKIFSTVVGNNYSDVIARAVLPNQKVIELNWDGTSMAAPLVAGAAALIWSKYPHESYLEIRKRLMQSVRKIPELESKVVTGGILDVAALMLH